MSELLTNLERLFPIDRAAGDDTLWQGHVYVPWGPLPAVLLVPFVAVWGTSIPSLVLTVPATVLSGVGLMRLWRSNAVI